MAILTFKYLRELQRSERDSPALQKIDRSFYIDCAKCLEVDSSEADSMRPLLKSIMEMRERKIIAAALQSVRAGISAENLLSEEDAFFSKIIEVVKTHHTLIENVLSEKGAARNEIHDISSDKASEEKKTAESPTSNGSESHACNILKIRAVSDIPPFVAENMKSYGPLNKGDVAELPKKAAEVLINANVAERID